MAINFFKRLFDFNHEFEEEFSLYPCLDYFDDHELFKKTILINNIDKNYYDRKTGLNLVQTQVSLSNYKNAVFLMENGYNISFFIMKNEKKIFDSSLQFVKSKWNCQIFVFHGMDIEERDYYGKTLKDYGFF